MFRRFQLVAMLLLCGFLLSCTGKNSEDANLTPKPESSTPTDLKTPSNPIQTEPPVALVPAPQQKTPGTEETGGETSTPLPLPTPSPATTADAAIPVPATVGLAEVQIPALQEQNPLEEKELPVLSQVNTDRDSTAGTALTEALSTPLPPDSTSETTTPAVSLDSGAPTSDSTTPSTPAETPPTDTSSEVVSNPIPAADTDTDTNQDEKPQTGEDAPGEISKAGTPTSPASELKDPNKDPAPISRQDNEPRSEPEAEHDPEQEIVIKAECKGKKTAVIKLMDSRKDKSEKISVQCLKDSAILKMTVKKKDIPFIRIETTAM